MLDAASEGLAPLSPTYGLKCGTEIGVTPMPQLINELERVFGSEVFDATDVWAWSTRDPSTDSGDRC